MFSTLSMINFRFAVTYILSSAKIFNLDQSKILLFGKDLNSRKSFFGKEVIWFFFLAFSSIPFSVTVSINFFVKGFIKKTNTLYLCYLKLFRFCQDREEGKQRILISLADEVSHLNLLPKSHEYYQPYGFLCPLHR